MTAKYGPLGIRTDDRYRNIPEARIVEMLLLAGWAYEVGSLEATEASKAALERWAKMGLGYRQAPTGERLFDPVEVNNFMRRAFLDARDDFWVERNIRTGRRMVLDLADSAQSCLSTDGEREFVVDFKRTFNLRSIASGSRLRLRAPLPLLGNYLRNLQVTPLVESDRNAQVEIHPGRIELRMVAAGEAEAVVGARLSFAARPQEPGPGLGGVGPDLALYLRHREGLIVVSERISDLARSLARTGAPSLEVVRAIWEYINSELTLGMLHYDQIDPASPCDSILDSGWFDCQMGAVLLASLCRARGIPARIVGGNFLYRLVPSNHYWAEVWIDDQGWTPFDFFGWDLAQGGRDLQWRDRFFGRIDHRLTSERMPREFIGALGVPIPPAWSILQTPTPGGVEIGFMDVNGTPVYTDSVRVIM